METCKLSDFMKALAPWLDREYIVRAHLDDKGHFVVRFTDGVKNVYNIEDCQVAQLESILEDLRNKGIQIGC